jgi:lactose/L-arabinose transport system ATP-binding protein
VPGLNNISVPFKATLPANGTELVVGIRPQHFVQSEQENPFKVDIIEHLGGVSYVHLHTPTGEKLIIEQRGSALERGVETINLALDVADVMIFDAQTNLRIR